MGFNDFQDIQALVYQRPFFVSNIRGIRLAGLGHPPLLDRAFRKVHNTL